MNINVKNKVLNYISIIVSPFFSWVIIIKQISHNKLDAFKDLYPLLIALTLIYFPLMPDMNSNLVKVIRGGYELNFYNSVQRFFLNQNISVGYYILLTYFIIYKIWIDLNIKVLRFKKIFKRNFFTCLIIIMFSITHREIGDLNRYLLASSVFILFYFNDYKRIHQIFLLTLSILIHSGVLLPIFILYLAKILSRIDLLIVLKKNMTKFILIIIATQFIIHYLLIKITTIIKIVNLKLGNQLYYYLINPKWGYLNIFLGTPGLIIYRLFNLFSIILVAIILLKSRVLLKEKKYIKNFYIIFLSIVLILLNYRTFSERYSLILNLIGIIYVFKYYDLRKNKKVIKKLMVFTVAKFLIFSYPYLGVWTNRYDRLKNKNIKYEIALKLLYLPGYELVNIEKNGYSNKILKENLKKKLW